MKKNLWDHPVLFIGIAAMISIYLSLDLLSDITTNGANLSNLLRFFGSAVIFVCSAMLLRWYREKHV